MLVRCGRHLALVVQRANHAAGAGVRLPVRLATTNAAPEELLAARQARRALRKDDAPGAASAGKARKAKQGGSLVRLAVLSAAAGGTAAAVHYKGDELYKLYEGTPLARAVDWIVAQVSEIVRPFTDPSSDKLLPDWPLPGMPPNYPCPPTLVLDLEETLVATVWDRKHGWRVAKRPGVDKFLAELSQYYEIAVITSMLGGIADPILANLDTKGTIHYRLFREATLWTHGKHVKDLSKINRPLRRIIVVDKDPGCFRLHPENGIRIKPYRIVEGVDPAADKSLELLLPFLRAIALEGVEDVRPVLRQYEGMDADAIGLAYKEKVMAARAKKAEAENRGLGGLVRGSLHARQHPQGSSGDDDEYVSRSSGAVPSSKDIVGATAAAIAPIAALPGGGPASGAMSSVKASVPLPPEKAGGIWKAWRERSKEAEEDHARKAEAWQRVMERKEEEAARRRADAARAAAATAAAS